MSTIWDDFLKIVKDDVGSRVVETWFKSIVLHAWDAQAETVRLKAPNMFVRDWVRDKYMIMMQTHLGRLLHVENPKIIFVDHEDTTQTVSAPPAVLPARFCGETKKKALVKTSSSSGEEKSDTSHINKVYSFNTFVVGPSNSLAYSAAHAISEQPGTLYNPLFIYGRSGLGKTHLLHSIGNGLRMRNKKMVVMYQTTDRFVSEFINAIRFNKVYSFQAKYKNLDALLIDDVQFLSRKEQTQEAFFHIFNYLYESNKQIVLSSDTVPSEISGLADRLQSRLGGGLVADVHKPSLETKAAIVKQKADLSNVFLDDEVAQFIASATDSNVRELEGTLIRVIACASLAKQDVTLELAQSVLQRVAQEPEKNVDFDDVVRCIERHYSFGLTDLRSKGRQKELVFARHVAMFIMKQATNKSLRDIGDYLGGRDHSTVMHAINKIKYCAQKDGNFAQQLKQMELESRP